MGWTDERVELLKKLWQDGLSAGQIARQLGYVSRNAVIGKVHRLGLGGRATPAKPQRIAYKPARPMRAPPLKHEQRHDAKVWGPTKVELAVTGSAATQPVRCLEEPPGAATVLTLEPHMFKWPIGDPRDPTFTHCGRRRQGEGPYCVEHAAIAYQPPQVKKKSNAAELARGLRRYI